jgi:hypothetical protein
MAIEETVDKKKEASEELGSPEVVVRAKTFV